ncbi:MAG: DUF2723 domain-containing protein [Bacteroidia bacterium]
MEISVKRFNLINNVTGWVVFAIAAFTYLATIEPTTSLWDTGEFISASYKLQVVHSPGAPFFLMLNRMFTLVADIMGDKSLVPVMVNASSALASAFSILFLFWTITAIAWRLLAKDKIQLSQGTLIAIMGAGIVGGLAYTWSDSFWFSAVEGEVYALSSFFTAIVFWLMLKWERRAYEKHSVRWLIFIAYLVGLAIGVHLLGLLVIPALAYIYYFRLYKPSVKGIIITGLFGLVALGVIQIGVIQLIPTIASKVELVFVNSMGLPFWSGAVFFFVILTGALAYGLYYTRKKEMVALHNALIALTVVMIGYTSNVMVVIRSAANPPIDMGDPEDVFSFISYLKREQYGELPLVRGPWYNAGVREYDYEDEYFKGDDEYVVVPDNKVIPQYNEADMTVFPRMWSPQQHHANFYKNWSQIQGDRKPNFIKENLHFFFTYQMGHMYWRYFAWNFIGRQNDIQGHGEFNNGNWISGIEFMDKGRVGPQKDLPYNMKTDKGRNLYFFLPFILGLLGMAYHYSRDKHSFAVVLIFFVMTGIAIGVYLNMPPLQPRERDYAFVGSFYVFAIWIGLGVLFIADLLRKRTGWAPAALIASVLGILVPIQMVSQTWDDHDRSGRFTSRDYANNYLQSCAQDAVLFTNGDNDTYPVWFDQEVLGIRTDVRVINLSLLNTSWYVHQMRQDFNESKGLKLSFTPDQLRQGTRDYVIHYENPQLGIAKDRYVDLKQMIEFIADDNPKTMVPVASGKSIYYFPTKKVSVPVNKQKVIDNGTVPAELADKIVSSMQWDLGKNTLMKNDLVVLDLIATNDWERPIYFAITTGSDAYINMTDYFQLEGLTYRLVPIKNEQNYDQQTGRINTDLMYDNVMNKFQWGRLDEEELYVDNVLERQCVNLRNVFARLARALIVENKNERAIEVLDRSLEVLPERNVPYDVFMIPIVELYYTADAEEKGQEVAERLHFIYTDELNYLMALDPGKRQEAQEDIQRNLYGLRSLVRMAQDAGQTAFAERMQADLDRYSGTTPSLP